MLMQAPGTDAPMPVPGTVVAPPRPPCSSSCADAGLRRYLKITTCLRIRALGRRRRVSVRLGLASAGFRASTIRTTPQLRSVLKSTGIEEPFQIGDLWRGTSYSPCQAATETPLTAMSLPVRYCPPRPRDKGMGKNHDDTRHGCLR
ncbi:hypothetical protein TPAR_03615 [Tolypocladium paradoxum]|uniref:Uncharacterized protein n=1 Tax=Tolypocladium paradoxum TaxID=94208 RepID=A0A2S4L169_9HYPO|nr:hypothetical protein TPAR_03615 [Tolypocladium paradoxum]